MEIYIFPDNKTYPEKNLDHAHDKYVHFWIYITGILVPRKTIFTRTSEFKTSSKVPSRGEFARRFFADITTLAQPNWTANDRDKSAA